MAVGGSVNVVNGTVLLNA
ncbi:hypothetical protein, partial [Legionella worsleiensis]